VSTSGVTVRKRLIICAILVAVLGISSALVIYLTASKNSDLDESDQVVVVDGKTFRIPLASTKSYRRELQRFGGGASLMFDDLDRWFSSLWHGRSLAVTLAWITGFVSLGLFLFARQIPPDPGRGPSPPDSSS
jgi:hypothetical protein